MIRYGRIVHEELQGAHFKCGVTTLNGLTLRHRCLAAGGHGVFTSSAAVRQAPDGLRSKCSERISNFRLYQ
jgi:hypothetical protein